MRKFVTFGWTQNFRGSCDTQGHHAFGKYLCDNLYENGEGFEMLY